MVVFLFFSFRLLSWQALVVCALIVLSIIVWHISLCSHLH